MATNLQAQADSALQDPESMDLQSQRAAEEAQATDAAGRPIPEFADDPDSADAPPVLEYDGKGHKADTTSMEFAEDETSRQMSDAPAEDIHQPAPTSQRQLEDIHRPVDDHTDQGKDFDQELLVRAKMYGLTDDQARQQYKTPAELESALLDIDRQGIQSLQQWRQWEAYQRLSQQQPPSPPQPSQQPPMQPPVPPQQTQPDQTNWTQAQIEAYKLKNPEVYDETLADDLTGLASQTAQQLTQQQQEMLQLRSLVEQQQSQLQRWQERQLQERQRQEQLEFDRRIRSLGNGWDEVLGDQDYTYLPSNSPEIANRGKVYETAAQLQQFHMLNGRFIPLADLLPTSLQLTFPERDRVAARGNNSSTAPTPVSRPTRRQHATRVSPREAALRKWDETARSQFESEGAGTEDI